MAHQLLKNDIELHEYWLVTPVLTGSNNPPPGLTQWMKWSSSTKETDTGRIPFLYTQLSELKNKLVNEPLALPDLSEKIKVITGSKEYDVDIITLFHAAGDFNFRSKWMNDVKQVEDVAHSLPRVGMRCRCIMEDGTSVIYSSSYSYTTDKIEFSETNENDNSITWFTLESLLATKTKLIIDIYFDKAMIDPSKKFKMETSLEKSLANLTEAVKEIKL